MKDENNNRKRLATGNQLMNATESEIGIAKINNGER